MAYTHWRHVRKVGTGIVLYQSTALPTTTVGKLVIDDTDGAFLQSTTGIVALGYKDGTKYITAQYHAQGGELASGMTDTHIVLRGNGTGGVCFGTHVGTGDAASNGYITIYDLAGNARKLMTTA